MSTRNISPVLLITLALLCSISLGIAPNAQAQMTAAETSQEKPVEKPVKKPVRKVLVSFDEDLIEGTMTGAELFLILQKKQTDFGRLFDLRENFTQEMYQDAEGM